MAGLGAGLDSATYNNTKELKEFFTEQKLIPLWRTVAAELTHQLLVPDFGDKGLMCDYDIQSVRALQPDVDNLYKRVNMGVSGGWITIGEARKVVGLDVDKNHDVYLRPLNMIQVDETGQAILNDPPQQNRDASRREQEQLQAANPRASTMSSFLPTGKVSSSLSSSANHEAPFLKRMSPASILADSGKLLVILSFIAFISLTLKPALAAS